MADIFIHESSYVDDEVIIGSGTKIWHFSHIMSGSKIGSNCNIGQNVTIGPHVAIGLRGPLEEDPHRGRGLAIGILASQMNNPADPDHPIPLFKGCPDPPGGPSFFIEDFTLNDGIAPISEWQLSPGQGLSRLQGHGIYRIDIHVSWGQVWAGVWKVTEKRSEL